MCRSHLKTEELIEYIMRQKRKIVFIDGPTNCGKTIMLKKLKAKNYNTVMVSGEFFYSKIIKNMVQDHPFEMAKEADFFIIEDLDFFGGRPKTEINMAKILSLCSENMVVIVSGIDIKSRMESLMRSLPRYEYFVKVDHNGEWNKNIKGD